ncbi:MAG: hypothetical protein MUE85_10240 [Microscillaceae bacterium]|nr:hypothetical protein [Microscillaceae bacterium]
MLLLPNKDLIIFDDRNYIPKKDANDNNIPNPRDIYIALLLDKLDAVDATKKHFSYILGLLVAQSIKGEI